MSDTGHAQRCNSNATDFSNRAKTDPTHHHSSSTVSLNSSSHNSSSSTTHHPESPIPTNANTTNAKVAAAVSVTPSPPSSDNYHAISSNAMSSSSSRTAHSTAVATKERSTFVPNNSNSDNKNANSDNKNAKPVPEMSSSSSSSSFVLDNTSSRSSRTTTSTSTRTTTVVRKKPACLATEAQRLDANVAAKLLQSQKSVNNNSNNDTNCKPIQLTNDARTKENSGKVAAPLNTTTTTTRNHPPSPAASTGFPFASLPLQTLLDDRKISGSGQHHQVRRGGNRAAAAAAKAKALGVMEPRPSTLQPDDNDDDEEQPSNCSIRGGGGGHTAAAAAVLDRRAHSRISSGAIPKRSHSDRGEGHRHQDPRVPSATKSPPSGSGKVATGTGSPWSSTTTAPSRFKYSPRKLEDDGDTPPRSTPGSSFQRFDSTALNRGDSLLSVNKDQEQHPGGLTKEVQQWESGLQHSLTNLESSHTFSLGAIQDNSDLEYCVYGGPDEKGLAVAFAVEEDDEDMFIPAAVEFDPDAKPPIFRNRRFRLYACLILSVVLILGTAGAVAGKMLSKRTDAAGAPLVAVPYRETLGIREAIERVVGSDQLDDLSNPYSTALNWITFIDPMELTPEKANFMQRYLIAYFYYATSVEKPWSGHCNPPEQNETEDCSHSVPVDVEASEEIAESKRWLTGLDECTWAGNFCDDSGQIVAMEHESLNMTGVFPTGITGLPFLQAFSLSFNELKGPLPTGVGDMRHLLSLALFGNQFTGTIPDDWYNSKSLQNINIAVNQITGSMSEKIGQLIQLKGLFLFENLMTGSLPSELGDLTAITEARMNDNLFTGTIPSTLGNLDSCRILNVFQNKLTGTIPEEIGLAKGLFDLRLNGNRLTGPIPDELFNLALLQRLDIHDNALTGTISKSMGNWKSVYRIRMENNQFEGTLPTELGLMKSMVTFVASGNEFVGTVPTALCNLRALRDSAEFDTVLSELQVDCGTTLWNESTPEITCPTQCCTQCCDTNGANCYTILDGL